MYQIGTPDIMIRVQAVFQLFCSQDCFTIQNAKSRKREIIQPNIYSRLPKYHDPSSSGSPDILFTRFHRFSMQKSRKGAKLCNDKSDGKEKVRTRFYFFMFIPNLKFQDPISNSFLPYPSVTDGRTGQAQTNMPPQLLRSWRHKTLLYIIILMIRVVPLFEPAYEIMVRFILRKVILQTRMRSHPVGLNV